VVYPGAEGTFRLTLSAFVWIAAVWFVFGCVAFALVRPLLLAGRNADEAYERQLEAAGQLPVDPEPAPETANADRLFTRREGEREQERAVDRV